MFLFSSCCSACPTLSVAPRCPTLSVAPSRLTVFEACYNTKQGGTHFQIHWLLHCCCRHLSPRNGISKQSQRARKQLYLRRKSSPISQLESLPLSDSFPTQATRRLPEPPLLLDSPGPTCPTLRHWSPVSEDPRRSTKEGLRRACAQVGNCRQPVSEWHRHCAVRTITPRQPRNNHPTFIHAFRSALGDSTVGDSTV